MFSIKNAKEQNWKWASEKSYLTKDKQKQAKRVKPEFSKTQASLQVLMLLYSKTKFIGRTYATFRLQAQKQLFMLSGLRLVVPC